MEKGTLYLVGTPIGNLGDFSSRGIEILQAVDFIAAEDTRVTAKLLRHFNIHTPLISYYKHNQHERGKELLSKLLSGKNIALVSDAGMPCISDPGEELVCSCAESDIKVNVVPGPSAVISALCLSGFPATRFCFEGFLSTTRKNRMQRLDEIKEYRETLIFYEAPHKLLKTLEDLYQVFGDRKIAIVKEITKLHENVLHTSLANAKKIFEKEAPKGEYVLVVEGATLPLEPEMTFEEAVALARDKKEQGLSSSQASKEAAAQSGYSKSQIYKSILD